jgi:predicted DCC family thiol-disulfide oxidoreductase YuxK
VPEVLFYDGGCGLCHRFVRFVATRDRAGRFAFAPLGGEHFLASVPEPQRAILPDSLVLRTADGNLHLRSSAVLAALRALGGFWRMLATAAGVVPAPVRDAVYDFVARVRYRVFGRTREACPIVPPDLRRRFLP